MSLNIEEITNSLKSLKQLKVVEPFYHDIGFAKYVNVQDSSSNPFTVLIFEVRDNDEIHPNQFLHKWRQLSSKQLIQKAANLQRFTHENMAKCFDSFQIESYFYIQIEQVEQTLLAWVNQHHNYKRSRLSKSMFIQIAFQMLESIQYLHQQKCILHHERLLECFMIDSKNQIKLFHFDFPEKVEVSIYQKIFLFQVENNEQSYYHPRFLDIKDRKYIYNYHKADIWSLAICFLQLNGISYMNILEFLQNQSIPSLPLESLGYELISILIHMLQSQEDTHLPSLPCLIQQFKNANKSIQNTLLSQNEQEVGYQTKGKEQENQDEQQENNVEQLRRYIINLASAINAHKIEDYTLAKELLLGCCKDFPNNDFAYLYLGQVDKENEMNYFDRALEINHQNDAAYILKAEASENNLEKQIQYLEKAIEINNNNDDYEQSLGLYYDKRGDQSKAFHHFKNSLSINECCFETLVILGNIAKRYGQMLESEQYYLRAIEINPSENLAYAKVGLVYLHTNQPEKAIEYFEKCISLNPENEIVFIILANCYESKEQFSKAIEILNKAIELNFKSAKIYKKLGDLQEHIGLRKEAISNFKTALVHDPSDSSCYNNLGLSYYYENQELKANQYYKKAIQLKTNDEIYVDNLGYSNLSLQQYEKVILLQKNCTNQNIPIQQVYASKSLI